MGSPDCSQKRDTSKASLVSLAHGTNDAQKTMGVITLTLITAGTVPAGAAPPVWVILFAGLVIALGTSLGGWRIIHTMGRRITDVEPAQGFAAETVAAAVILTSSQLGFALSTTHVCAGGVVGSGVGKRLADVRWTVAGRMVVAWALTLPAAAVVGALAGETASTGTAGVLVVAGVGAFVGAAAWILSRRNPVGAHNV